jgi:hypothetical protein
VKLRKLFLQNKSQQALISVAKKKVPQHLKELQVGIDDPEVDRYKTSGKLIVWPDFFSQSSLRCSAVPSETDGRLAIHFLSAYRISPLFILAQNF